MLQKLGGGGFPILSITTHDKVVSQLFRSRRGTHHEDVFTAFRGTEERQRALAALAASLEILGWNNQYVIVGYCGAVCPGPQHVLIKRKKERETNTENKMSYEDMPKRESITWPQTQRLERWNCKPRSFKNQWPPPRVRKKRGGILPYKFQKEFDPVSTLIPDF